MNEAPTNRSRSLLHGELAFACSQVLAALCALETVLPRAGRAAAALLLRRDSAVLRVLERAGAAVQGLAAKPILYAALAVCAATTVSAVAAKRPLRAAACAALLAAAAWYWARSGSGDAAPVWGPVVAAHAIAAVWILGSGRSASALGAAALQAGLGAYAAWALLVGRGSAAIPSLERASEALVLGGIALAGLGAWRRASLVRTGIAAAAVLGVGGVSVLAPDGSHAVVRHLVAAGASGLPFAVTASLLAAALGGLVLATVERGLCLPLLIALVCARRPEAWFVCGGLAASSLLMVRPLRAA